MERADGGSVVKELYYAMKGGSAQFRREGDSANAIFRRRGRLNVQNWLQYTIYIDILQMPICAQSVSCLKSKYPSYFSALWVSRHVERDDICAVENPIYVLIP